MAKIIEVECWVLNQQYMEDLAKKIAEAEPKLLPSRRTIKKLDVLKDMTSPRLKVPIFTKVEGYRQIGCDFYRHDIETEEVCSVRNGKCIYSGMVDLD